ncbi:HNH endonuclease [Prauserella endophytica]|uniref:HNH endonuclease n=1 Tax=Prauserella endophytica TaxID=1592324 RepID=A0ABY2RS46_9PSEU|nr:HNH endonuclease [Prauserella endophytica]TKG57947.1 HNH endonuclease [Prauserella endophytica]
MSTAWKSGSTRRWRKIRLFVLNRDRWICQLCGKPISKYLRHPHPYSAHVHHTKGKAYGDDPEFLVAAHRKCNLDAGDPTAAPDPAPRPMTRW